MRCAMRRFFKNKSPIHADLSFIHSPLPHHTEELICILRSLRTHESRNLWDLLVVVVKMLHNRDPNALSILQMYTHCILEADEVRGIT